jgi:hypothetical protein
LICSSLTSFGISALNQSNGLLSFASTLLKGNRQHPLKYINMITTSGKEASQPDSATQAKLTHPHWPEIWFKPT